MQQQGSSLKEQLWLSAVSMLHVSSNIKASSRTESHRNPENCTLPGPRPRVRPQSHLVQVRFGSSVLLPPLRLPSPPFLSGRVPLTAMK